MTIDLIYEDNHQLVVNKPAGLLTQPSGTENDSLEQQAKLWIKEKLNKSGNVYLHAVHRLDKPVSGIVLFARTSKALSRLQESLRSKQCKKIYIAIVEGDVSQTEGTLEHYHMHDDYHAEITSTPIPGAKIARLHYKVIKKEKNQTVLEIELETGRYHQIRAQLAFIGHPILGDEKYGSRFPFAPNAIALHHHQLQIPHPITGQMQTFKS